MKRHTRMLLEGLGAGLGLWVVLGIVLGAAMLFTGCATSVFKEVVLDPATGEPVGTTSVRHTVFAPPGAQAVANQKFDYEAFKQWRLKMGQVADVKGGDPTQLFEMLTKFAEFQVQNKARQAITGESP